MRRQGEYRQLLECPAMPIKLFAGIRPLGRSGVLRDLLAGASAASINIPQVLGYARIAGTPVVTGLDCSAITDIDYSAAQVMRDLLNDLAQRHIRVLFARVSPYMRPDMHRHSLTPVVGEGCIFGTLHEALATVSGGMSPRA